MTWDYIIVGAGSAGCAAAHELAKTGRSVLVIEAGGMDRSPFIKFPAGIIRALVKHDWQYQSEPDPTRKQRRERWLRGRVVGGSSSINGMIYVRGNLADYDRWRDIGNVGWGSEDVTPIFRSIERCDPDSMDDPENLRGRSGPLHVRMVRKLHRITNAFVDSARSAGYAFNSDYNGARQDGIGYTQMTQRRRRRWSAADAFLRPSLRRSNIELVTGALVHKVLIKDGRAHGVRYERNGSISEVHGREIIVSSGAINTPKLLMMSGIGNTAELGRHGIDVVLDRAAVGQGLMEHPTVRTVYLMNIQTYNITGLLQKIRVLAKYVFHAQGPLASPFEAMMFLATRDSDPRPDVQLHFSPLGIDTGDENNPFGILEEPAVMISVKANYPASVGRIRLNSSDPKTPPVIEPNLLGSEEDLATLIRGIEAVRGIMAREPIASHIVSELRPGADRSEREALADFVREKVTVAYHPVGTCRMGVDDQAVVNPEQQVVGIENLWIADASIMPTHVSGNTNAVSIMIGAKLGRQLANTPLGT